MVSLRDMESNKVGNQIPFSLSTKMECIKKLLIFTFLCFLWQCLVSSLTLLQKAELLVPISYKLAFNLSVNVPRNEFNYSLQSEVHFDLPEETDEIVLESTVEYILLQNLTYDHHDAALDVKYYRNGEFYIIYLPDSGSYFEPGHYSANVLIEGKISDSHGRGIQHSRFMDNLKKDV